MEMGRRKRLAKRVGPIRPGSSTGTIHLFVLLGGHLTLQKPNTQIYFNEVPVTMAANCKGETFEFERIYICFGVVSHCIGNSIKYALRFLASHYFH